MERMRNSKGNEIVDSKASTSQGNQVEERKKHTETQYTQFILLLSKMYSRLFVISPLSNLIVRKRKMAAQMTNM